MTRKKKYYAVRKGLKPGIYTSWEECEKNTKRFPDAKYKGFYTMEEAEDYLNNTDLGENIANNNNKPWYEKVNIWIAIIAGIFTILQGTSWIIDKINENHLYKYIKYEYKNVWEFDEEWVDDVIPSSDTCKLYARRTLYHGQRKITQEKITYKHKKINEDGTENIIWTDSEKSPESYEYANETTPTTTIKYENLGKWVTNEDRLGEYTYNIIYRKQYKYRRLVQKKILLMLNGQQKKMHQKDMKKSN